MSEKFTSALITGASSGIGAEIAIHFARLGYEKIAIVARRRNRLEQVKEQCLKNGAKNVLILERDLGKPNDVCEDIIDEVVKEFGELHVLINNAAVATIDKSIANTETKDLDLMFNVNFKSPALLSKFAVPHLKKTKGTIINISSVGGIIPCPGVAVYGAFKAALQHFAKTLALEVANDGIRINTICPGGIVTEMIEKYFGEGIIDIEKQTGPEMPMVPLGKRMGTVQEMAKLVGFIASKDNSFMTGQDIVADGGYALYGAGSNSPQ